MNPKMDREVRLCAEDDDLISSLSKEELERFSKDFDAQFDPENLLLPASERVKDQTTKEPTGPYSRESLLNFMKTKAEQTEDLRDQVPYEKKVRGKVFEAPPKPESPSPFLGEFNLVLDNMTEEDMLEISGMLGLHCNLDQDQSRTAVDLSYSGSNEARPKPRIGTVRCEPLKHQIDPNDVNKMDLKTVLYDVKYNSHSLTSLNLNNHKDITSELLFSIIRNLSQNTMITTLSLANCKVTDTHIKELVRVLKTNTSIKILNLESNQITADGIEAIVELLKSNTVIMELKLANQVQAAGYRAEDLLAGALMHNTTLLRLGFSFQSSTPRMQCDKYIMRNLDLDRKRRQTEKIKA